MPMLRHFILALSALVLVACGDETGPQRIDSVAIVAADGDSTPSLLKGRSLALVAHAIRGGNPVSGVEFTWRSETPDLATVSATGVVQALNYGEARIVAETEGGGASGTIRVQVVGQPIDSLELSPADLVLGIGGTGSFTVKAFDSLGNAVAAEDIQWSITGTAATLDATTGQLTAVRPGSVTVFARTWHGRVASGRAHVSHVTSLVPDTGRYGSLITLRGAQIPASPRIEFAGGVRADVKSASADSIVVWVPVGATTGPLSLISSAGTFALPSPFTLTAAADIFEPANDTAYAMLPIPSKHMGLQAEPGGLDAYGVQLASASAFTFTVYNRGARDGSNWVIAYVIRESPGPAEVAVGFLWPLNLIAGVHTDSAVYSATLPPGTYGLQVYAFYQTSAYAYGISVEATTRFGVAPDRFELNDFPSTAAAISLPFDEGGLALENGNAQDYYRFDLTVPSTVTLRTSGTGGDADLYLLSGDTIDAWFASAGQILRRSENDRSSNETITADLNPGRYSIFVRDYSGVPSNYRLEASAVPSSGGAFDMDAGPPAATRLPKWPPRAGALRPPRSRP